MARVAIEALLLKRLNADALCRTIVAIEIGERQAFEAGSNWWITGISIEQSLLTDADLRQIERRVIAAAAALGREVDVEPE